MTNTVELLKDYLFRLERSYFTSEEVAKDLGLSRTEVIQAIHKLRVIKGWSIIAENNLPYRARVEASRRNDGERQKGEIYEYDWAEPSWQRTIYLILKKPEVTNG